MSRPRLVVRGARVGLVTNDQAPNLVDTEILRRKGLEVEEVAGSCFCCNFTGQALADLTRVLATAFPQARLHPLSAQYGIGIDEWLQEATRSSRSGMRVAEVDYSLYAEGERLLGWLNAEFHLSARATELDWDGFSLEFLELLKDGFQSSNASVGHVKMLLSMEKGFVVSNLTESLGTASLQTERAGCSGAASAVLNARAGIPPELLEDIVCSSLDAVCGDRILCTIRDIRSIRPGIPRPTHRYGEPVASQE